MTDVHKQYRHCAGMDIYYPENGVDELKNWLKKGDNEIIVLDVVGPRQAAVWGEKQATMLFSLSLTLVKSIRQVPSNISR